MRSRLFTKQRGHVSTEWTVATLLMLGALFLPIADGQSVMALLMESVQGLHKHSSFILSLP